MMQGVEVLTQHTYATNGKIILTAICMVVGFLTLMFGIMALVDAIKESNVDYTKKDGTTAAILLSIAAFCISIVFGISFGDIMYNAQVEEYQVTIDENVSMVEFMEKYEILKQDGKIYTITEKVE